MNKSTLLLILFVITGTFLFTSCEKESFTTDSGDKLSFSLDTLMFDTIFTEIGSVTKAFKAINPHDQSIRISSIQLAKQNDFFRVNIDGIAADKVEDVEILPNDSIYVYVELTIDPNLPLSISPYFIEEDVLFVTNGNEQKVHLTAWGQDANYLPYKNGGGIDYGLNCESDGDVIWDDPKPYVIYGRLFIDSCELIIPEGTEIFVHGGVTKRTTDDGTILYNDGAIVVINQGKITVNGSADNPVVFQGDRLDEEYQEKYGQWFGFFLANNTQDNVINHAVIKNAIRGIYVDSASELTVKSSIIQNTLGTGIEARHASVNLENCLIYNNLSSAVQFTFGGNYSVNHCTFISNDNSSAAMTAINYTCTDFSNCVDARFNILNLNMNNNIIYGDQDDELVILDGSGGELPGSMNYQVNNSLIKMKELLNQEDFTLNYKDCIAYESEATLFLNEQEFDYHLDTFSIAEKQAKPLLNVKFDLDGNDRDGLTPDIGCYEFQ